MASIRRPSMTTGSEAARLALLLTFIGVVPVGAQERPDTVRAIPINPIDVSVLRGPIEAGREPYPVSSLGVVALQQGKTAAFLEEALEALPGVQVQNRFNYAVGERLSSSRTR